MAVKIMKRMWIAIAIITVIAITVPIVYYVFLQTPPQEITLLCPVDPQVGYWEFLYAVDSGIFREEGINVSIVVVRSPQQAHQSFLAGEAEFMMAAESGIQLRLMGEPTKTILCTARNTFALWVKPEIESIYNVTTIGMPHGRGGAGDSLTREYLLSHGLTPDVDVTIRYMDHPAILPALLAGEIDAATLSSSAGLATYNLGYYPLFGYAIEYPDYMLIGLTTTETIIDEQPDACKAIVKGVYRSLTYIMTHKEETIDYAVNTLGFNQEEATFIYEWMYENEYGGRLLDLPADGIEYTMKMLAKYLDYDEIPVEDCIDSSFLEQAKAELGIP